MTARQKIHVFSKIFICSIGIFVMIQALVWLFQSSQSISYGEYSNDSDKNLVLSSAYKAQAAGAGVAISTRIGIGKAGNSYGQNKSTGMYTYTAEQKLSHDFIEEKLSHDFIEENLIYVREYLNYSRVDVKKVLSSSSNKKQSLDSLISGFEERAKNAQTSITNLEKRKQETLSKLEATRSNIELIKTNMESHFSAGEANSTLVDIEKYYKEREKYTEYFTHIVFINQFLKQYNFLIEYNSGVLNTMKLNKKALIDGSYVIIPENGGEYLKPLELIFDEGESE